MLKTIVLLLWLCKHNGQVTENLIVKLPHELSSIEIEKQPTTFLLNTTVTLRK